MTAASAPGRAGLLRLIKDLARSNARFEASVVTTYAFNGTFYEDVLLRAFERAGSRLNIVLADAGQLASVMEDPARRPLRAGRDYILCPVPHDRAFHPKVLMLLSEKEALLAIGSHNLTDAGFSHNEEVTTLWHKPALPPARVLQDALDYVLGWLGRAGTLPAAYDDIAARLRALASAAPKGEDGGARLAVDGEASLLETLAGAVTGPVQRAVVVGPYFDRDFAVLHRLDATFSPGELLVALEPGTALVGDPALAPAKARFTDIAPVTTGLPRRSEPGFLHAKIVALETRGGRVVCAGSANPTLAGWDRRQGGNAEANVLLTGAAAELAWHQLGLGLLGSAPSLEGSVLQQAAERSASQRQLEAEAASLEAPIPVIPAALDAGGILVTGLPANTGPAGIRLRFANGLELPAARPPPGEAGLWIPGEGLGAGPCGLYRGAAMVAHVIVHDPARVRAGLMSRGGAQLLASLGRIDQYEGFDEVFDLITRHVLPEAPPTTPGPSRPGTGAGGGEEKDVNEGNGAPTGDRRASAGADANQGASALQQGGLIEELIAALLGSLYTQPQTTKDGDGPDKDAEDAGEEDPDPEETATGTGDEAGPADTDWPALVRACRRKASTLTHRLKARVAAQGSPVQAGQVLAVLCLVQKLRMLQPPPGADERSAKESLIEAGHLATLRDIALGWAGEPGVLAALAPAEASLLASLLAWYLRETGGDCWAKAPFREEEAAQAARLQARADLVATCWLLPAISDPPSWLTRRDDQLARWADASAGTQGWWDRHLALGQALHEAAADQLPAATALAAGDIVLQGPPGSWTWPRLVQQAAGAKAWLWVPGGGERQRLHAAGLRRVPLAPPLP